MLVVNWTNLWKEKLLNFQDKNINLVENLRKQFCKHNQSQDLMKEKTPIQSGFCLGTISYKKLTLNSIVKY